MEYNFKKIEQDWQQWWKENKIYKVSNDSPKPKCYVLDMFPYPSGAGLHVGHPLGYIASDIYARYKRLKGFNVLHPMGYDAFGLPAEQYAIEHGIHPAVSTAANIKNFRGQLDKIGFSFDWDREVNTSEPKFYKWTQWIFLQLFNSYFCHTEKKALPISLLIKKYETKGAMPKTGEPIPGKHFTAEQWNSFSEKEKAEILMRRRLVYCGIGEVNWCEALGTVLANDEVINGVSERGGYPVVKKKLRQWYLRITEYADRLLEGLDHVDFSEAMKEMQSNWIGKSMGAEISFELLATSYKINSSQLKAHGSKLVVYTTRPDTIFGVDFMVIAPEHEILNKIVTDEHRKEVEKYLEHVKSRSERERMAEKKISGVFTGAYCIHPFSKKQIPVWISEYVLISYGTGAIMAVPCGDERDHRFAKHFNIPITNIIGKYYNGEEANDTKDAILENSDFLNGMVMKDAIEVVIKKLEELGIGKRKVNYKMRDAAFSRQRYWGEPFPIVWKNNIAYPLDESELPILLPEMEDIKPGPDGEGPLANLEQWVNSPSFGGSRREVNTMPGYAGSSWYFLRYMDPDNEKEFCNRKNSDYWNQADLYIGGTEHAVGHLLYSRMWTKFLYDRGWIGFDEPYKKLVNQGMIQGSSRFVYRVFCKAMNNEEMIEDGNIFVSKRWFNEWERIGIENKELRELLNYKLSKIYPKKNYEVKEIVNVINLRINVDLVDGVELMITEFKQWRNREFEDAEFIFEEGISGKYICGTEVEKMSKSKFNTVNPNDIVEKYGADTFRMYEMFLGPIEMSKPWDTKGIEGVYRFLKKFWRLYFDEMKGKIWAEEKANNEELKVLHKTIKKNEEDTERFSFNTAVSTFMIAVNELSDLKCHKKEILEPLLILLAPYAPHICEELWHQLGNETSITNASFPKWEEEFLAESSKDYPVSINGRHRTNIRISLDASQGDVEKIILANEVVKKWLDGKPHKKIIYVKGKMVNVVL